MRFEHPGRPGRSVRLAYCLNLHAAEDLAGILEGLRRITLPLRDRLAPPGPFGIGMYFPAQVAAHLGVQPDGLGELEELLAAEALDPFTFNAFPYGGFHDEGLKRGVFAPTWSDPERLRFTMDVAEVAARLNAGRDAPVSISTHPGRFGPWHEGEFELAVEHFGSCLRGLAELRASGGPTITLAVEAEPRAVAGDTAAWAAQQAELRERLLPELGEAVLEAHLATCLDACHSAVQFEEHAEAVELATRARFGKLQYSSALRLLDPDRNPDARAALFGLDEPRYLHQTTGRHGRQLLLADDLPELRRAWDDPQSPWAECDEWRTHFHVPVDLESLGPAGLQTTRDHASRILKELLDRPEDWGASELQVEIETYTWDVLPGWVRGEESLVAGLEREYRHVLAELAAEGWEPVPEPN